MLTSQEINDLRNARIAAYLPQFEAASAPDPDSDDWSGWTTILADGRYDPAIGPAAAMCIASDWGFGTVSSALLAFPAPGSETPAGIYHFASGRPDENDYQPV